jgi:PhzF family phenazine biosynthesis protein
VNDSDRRETPFKQVDVFTGVPFKGNPVAVVLDGDALTSRQMRAIANWTNLSETTFVCTPIHPDADYLLRIFTPRTELPFAGHPTIGSAWAVLEHGVVPRTPGVLVQECAKGLVTVRIEDDALFFALPEPSFSLLSTEDVAAACAALGIPTTWVGAGAIVDVGAVWTTLQLPSADTVLGLEPDMPAMARLGSHAIGITVFGLYAEGAPAALEVRSFAPADGVPEDPVCGSGNGCVAAMVQRHGLITGAGYVASQGRRLGRDGRIEVRFAEDAIWVGGNAVTCIEGALIA